MVVGRKLATFVTHPLRCFTLDYERKRHGQNLMKIIDEILLRIESHPNSGSSQFLAIALASACNSQYKISLLDASTKLDNDSKYLVAELANIAQQSDFSNSDQDRALSWLSSNKFI